MAPIGGEETGAVVETSGEKKIRLQQEEEKHRREAFQAVTEIANKFVERAQIANYPSNTDYKVTLLGQGSGGNRDSVSLLEITITKPNGERKSFLQPIVDIVRPSSLHTIPLTGIACTDGSYYPIIDSGLRTISTPNRNKLKYPLWEGLDQDPVVSEHKQDYLSIGVNNTLHDKSKVSIARVEITPNMTLTDLQEQGKRLQKTFDLADKLVTGERISK